METLQLRVLELNELPEATNVMSRAFLHDPIWMYMYKNEQERLKYLERFFNAMLCYAIYKKAAYGVGTPVVAVAVWDIPNNQKFKFSFKPLLPMIRLVLSPFIFRGIKVYKVFASFQKLQKKYAPFKHYKLEAIGVHPTHQGKGYSSALIKPILLEAEKKKMAVYTETMTPANVELYEHFGFKVMEQLSFDGKNLQLWTFLKK